MYGTRRHCTYVDIRRISERLIGARDASRSLRREADVEKFRGFMGVRRESLAKDAVHLRLNLNPSRATRLDGRVITSLPVMTSQYERAECDPKPANWSHVCILRNGSISRSVVSAVTQPDHRQKMRAANGNRGQHCPNGGYAARLVVRREPLTGQKQSSPGIPAPELLRGVVLRAVGRNALRPTYKRYHLASRSAMPPSWGWCFPQTSPVSWLNARRQ